MTEPGQLIKEARTRRKWSQGDLAKQVGISQPAIKKIEAGETLLSKHLPKIAQILGIDLNLLDRSLADDKHSRRASAAQFPPLKNVDGGSLMGSIDLPVYALGHGSHEQMTLAKEPFSRVARPHNLIGINSAYGVLVLDDTMSREFNAGDTAYVNPHLLPRVGDPCLFQSPQTDGIILACLKYLVRLSNKGEGNWMVSQSNPLKQMSLSKIEWPICHVIVGKLSGR